jgi:hypothetical protein
MRYNSPPPQGITAAPSLESLEASPLRQANRTALKPEEKLQRYQTVEPARGGSNLHKATFVPHSRRVLQ